MKEIPLPLVRANQVVLVVGTLAAILLQNGWILLVMFLLTLSPLVFGAKGNIVFRLAGPILAGRIEGAQTEAAQLQRFNQSIACILLGLASIIYWTTTHWGAWVLAGMVTVAAGVALAGFCIGCVIYYQWRKWSHQRSSS